MIHKFSQYVFELLLILEKLLNFGLLVVYLAVFPDFSIGSEILTKSWAF